MKKNSILDNIRVSWIDFKDWIDYVKSQRKYIEKMEEKENIINGLNTTIENKNKNIEKLKQISKAKDELLDTLENKIVDLKGQISDLKKEGK